MLSFSWGDSLPGAFIFEKTKNDMPFRPINHIVLAHRQGELASSCTARKQKSLLPLNRPLLELFYGLADSFYC